MQDSKPNVAALVEGLPAADRPNQESKFTGPAPDAAVEVFEQILRGGSDSVGALVDLVHESTDPEFKNFKAEYALNGLAVHVGRPGKEAQRRLVAETLASRIGGGTPSKGVQGLLIRALQVAGGPEVVETLGGQLDDDALCEYATQALIAIGYDAGAQFGKALPKAKGKNRITIIQALGSVKDANASAALRDAVGDDSEAVRLAAGWALANTGDPAAADVLLGAAKRAEGWERIQATKACLLLAENLAAAGSKNAARRVYQQLRSAAEPYVQEAAERGLAAIKQ